MAKINRMKTPGLPKTGTYAGLKAPKKSEPQKPNKVMVDGFTANRRFAKSQTARNKGK